MPLQQEVLVQGLSRAGVCLPEPVLLGWGWWGGGDCGRIWRISPGPVAAILMDMHLSIKAVQQSKMFLLQDRRRHKINVQT